MESLSQEDKEKIVTICDQLINGNIEFVKGCRKLLFLWYDLNLNHHDECFTAIVAFCSDIDDYPDQDKRNLYSKEYLEKADKEVNNYILQAKPSIFNSCKKIIEKYTR